jgi:hypothetical protein
MKVEDSAQEPKLNLLQPEGQRSQGHAENVSDVLVNDLGWMPVIEGTFHYYVSQGKGGKPGVPFIQFEIADDGANKVVELFPTSVAGIAYKKVEE